MAAVGNADVVALELEKVLPKVTDLFERDDKFYTTIKKRNVEKISNRQMRIPMGMRPGGAFQYFDPDGGDLGRGGGPQWDKAVIQCVFMSENIEYTKLAQWGTDSNVKSVKNAVREMVAKALDEMRRQIEAQLQTAGDAAIGTITTAAASGGSDTYTMTSDGFGAKLVRYGQTVQVFPANLSAARGSAVVTFYDIENNTIKVTPSVSGAAPTDRIVVAGVASPTALPGLYGVPYFHSNASTGTLMGFNRSTTPEVRASRVNANNAALTLPLPRIALNKIGNRVGIDHDFKPRAWMHPAQAAAYESIGQLISTISKGPKEESLDLYFGEHMQMAGAPVETNYVWNKTRIDFILDDVWGRGEILPIGFYTTDGRNYFEIRGTSGGVVTADIFYMVVGMQMYVTNPAACAYIDNLTVPTGY